jgi:hypothetical protein
MTHGDVREEKWRGNLRMMWVASTLHTTSEHGVSSIITSDALTSAASSQLNWRPRRFKWTRPFLQVCHHVSNAVYFKSCNECASTSFQSVVTQILHWSSDSAYCEDKSCIVVLWTAIKCFSGILCLYFKGRTGRQTGNWFLDVGTIDWCEAANNPLGDSRPKNEKRWKKL